MSRAPVREAIARLVSDGLVEQVPGLGASVRLPDPRELAETFEARKLLEVFAAERAAVVIREDQISHLEGLCETMLEALGQQTPGDAWTEEQRSRMLEMELEFHLTIARAAGNETICGLIEGFLTVQFIVTYHPQIGQASSLETRRFAWERHTELMAALRRHDAEAAGQSMGSHIDNGATTAVAACRELHKRLRAGRGVGAMLPPDDRATREPAGR